MAGIIQVQSSRKQLNPVFRQNKDLPPESSRVMAETSAVDKAKSCSEKECGQIQNCEKHSKSNSTVCGTRTERQGNGDRQSSCRRHGSIIHTASHTERNKGSIKSENSIKGGSGVSNVPKAVARKMVSGSIAEQNSYSYTMPPSNTCCIDKQGSIKPETTRRGDSLIEGANGASDSATAPLTRQRNWVNSQSNTMTDEQLFLPKVNQTNEASTAEQSYANYPHPRQSVLKVSEIRKDMDEKLAGSAATDKTYKETPIFVQSTSKSHQIIEIAKGPDYVMYSQTDNESVVENYDGGSETQSEMERFLSDQESDDLPILGREAGVQTSFVSIQQTPCSPETCPKRKRKIPKDVVSKNVQTDEKLWFALEAAESKGSPTPQSILRKTTIVTVQPFVLRKRTRQMDDRLLRRIVYFDSNHSSVCNKDVEFCTYRIHRFSKTMDPKKLSAGIKICPDCRSDRKCLNALRGKSDDRTCEEIAIEVVSLELWAPAMAQFLKTCLFVYIDYVFVGHVGNETFLAPVSRSIHFDSKKSYCVSMTFNKKERSIIREQVNPKGLLAKDSIMFILVCHAAPEFDILKNWDYAYGYLSMKTLMEQNHDADKAKWEVEMTKIGSTEKIGTLHGIFEGLELVRTIRDEDDECMEQRPDYVLKKLMLINNDIKGIEKNQ